MLHLKEHRCLLTWNLIMNQNEMKKTVQKTQNKTVYNLQNMKNDEKRD